MILKLYQPVWIETGLRKCNQRFEKFLAILVGDARLKELRPSHKPVNGHWG